MTTPTFKLNDGNNIPSFGFGTFQIPADGSTYTAVKMALAAGYRHIDTAVAYFNEQEVGKAIKDSGIPRNEIWITSKMWLQDYKYEDAKKSIETSLKKLGVDYIDPTFCTSHMGPLMRHGEPWKKPKRPVRFGQLAFLT